MRILAKHYLLSSLILAPLALCPPPGSVLAAADAPSPAPPLMHATIPPPLVGLANDRQNNTIAG